MIKSLKAYIPLLFLFFTSCFTYHEVDVLSVGEYRISNVTKDNVNVSINMEVNNPNGYNIRLKKTDLDLYVEGEKVGIATITEDVVLKKRTQEKYKLTFESNYKELSGSILGRLPSLLRKSTIKVGLKGKVKAKANWFLGKKFDLDVEESVNVAELSKLIQL